MLYQGYGLVAFAIAKMMFAITYVLIFVRLHYKHNPDVAIGYGYTLE